MTLDKPLKSNDSQQEVSFDSGEIIFSEGSPGGEMFIITKGKVEIFKTYRGKEFPLVVMGHGEIIGNMTITDHSARTASARAVTDVKATQISHSRIAQLVTSLPAWAKSIIRELTGRLKDTSKDFVENAYILHNQKVHSTPLSLFGRFIKGVYYISREQMHTNKKAN